MASVARWGGSSTRRDWPFTTTLVALGSFLLLGHAYLQLEPRYRLADQVPDREQALGATERIDQKLTGDNPVHIMIEWQTGESIYAPGPLSVIAAAHEVLEKQAGLGNVWSLESLRRWLKDAGDDRPETIRIRGLLPEHLVRRFIAKEGNAVLVTGRLPDVDSSRILPVVEKIDRALDQVRAQHPQFRLSVTGLPAIAARNSARMISQLNESLPICVAFAAVLLALAFRWCSWDWSASCPAFTPWWPRARLSNGRAAASNLPPWWRCWWYLGLPSTR